MREFDKVDLAMVGIAPTDEISAVVIYLEVSEEISESEKEDIIIFVSESLNNFNKDKIEIIFSDS